MTHKALKRAPFALVLAAALAASFAGSPAGARADDDGYGTDAGMSPAAVPVVARIAVVAGRVGIKRGDGGEQTAAAMNAPLMAGDYLTTGADGRVEVQLDANTIVRAGADSQLRFTRLDGQSDVAQLAQGTMELRVLSADQDQVSVQTPSVDVEPSQAGAYLIKVTRDGNTEVTARSGSLAVVTPQGTQEVDPGRTMLIAGTANNPQYQYEDEVALTGLEAWGNQRDEQMLAAQNTDSQYLGSDVAGASDLNADGQWVDIPGYGNAWVPSDVSSNWTPYSDGAWTNEPYYGSTWVGAEPWGWAPYHYGRWFYAARFGWAWTPGPRSEQARWSPALVAFFGFGGGAGLGVGFDNVGWVPLAPGEYGRPWWGRGNSLVFNVGFNNYRNYAHGFVGVPFATWQHGVIRNVRPMSAPQLAQTRFYRGAFGQRSNRVGFVTTRRSNGLWQRFHAAPNNNSKGWQRFNGGAGAIARRAYAVPSYARSYQAQPYNRGYQARSYARSYQAPSYNRGYQARSYARSYQAPSYKRGYQAPSYKRGYQARSYNRGYQSPRYQAPRRASTQRGGRGGRPHGPGRS